MSLFEALRLAVDAIWSHKLRSFLTLLGVIFGVATVIVVVSLVEGFNKYVDEKIANIGTNAFSLQRYAIEDFSSVENLEKARRRNKDVTLDDLAALRERGAPIGAVGAKADTVSEVKFADKRLNGVAVKADTYNMTDIEKTDIELGRSFNKTEEENNRAVCYIGAEVAEQLFENKNPLGQTIKIDNRPFEVVGVAKALGSVFGQPRDKFVAVPLTTFLGIYGTRRSLSVIVTSTNAQGYDDAVEEARTVIRVRRKLGPNEPDNFGIVTPSAINQLRDKIFGTIQVAAIGVTSISLVVGGIVIMNIMLVSVTERTKEIGIRKAIGARRRDVLKQFLFESTLLSLTGGAIGVTAAYLVAKAVYALSAVPTSLPLRAVATALFVSGSVGVISGLYPAWKAASLDPILAMRAD